MSIVPIPRRPRRGHGYPTSDGKPMAETERLRDLMLELIHTLKAFYAQTPRVCVSGNMLMFYEQGNKRKHISPDVFVTKGVEKRERENYLVWEEGQPPHVVIELTSSSTRSEDTKKKLKLYQDTLKVREYFLFDPNGDYLKPRLQGHRLRKGVYQPIAEVAGRLPSQVLGLHLERDGNTLRLWNPDTNAWLLTPQERIDQGEERAEQAEARADQAERELERALRELDELRRRGAR
jgi:Uma2 family endonuclease